MDLQKYYVGKGCFNDSFQDSILVDEKTDSPKKVDFSIPPFGMCNDDGFVFGNFGDFGYLNEPQNCIGFDTRFDINIKDTKKQDYGKGLRHFSRKVCEKVREKGTTTYNEVANEIVKEYSSSNCKELEHKNIKRRVYDAFNVLVAMNIIAKEKKEIRWVGLPSSQNASDLDEERRMIKDRIETKKLVLEETKRQYHLYKKLEERNKSKIQFSENGRIQIPFILVHTSCLDEVHCTMNEERSNFVFTFSKPFWICDDSDVVKEILNDHTNTISPLNLNYGSEKNIHLSR